MEYLLPNYGKCFHSFKGGHNQAKVQPPIVIYAPRQAMHVMGTCSVGCLVFLLHYWDLCGLPQYCPLSHPLGNVTLSKTTFQRLKGSRGERNFPLNPGQSTSVSVPAGWSGRLWGRTLCSQDPTTGKFTCITGDCGSGTVECAGGAAPPATLAEFTLNGAGGLDFYDVSLVDGYNLPMLVVPQGGSGGNCTTAGCVSDLNDGCPSELKVMSSSSSVACKSACDAFGDPEYCCSGAYGNPQTCQPTSYSEYFKSACPRAYSYAYDDGTSTFTCASADYIISFCPTPAASKKSAGSETAGAGAGDVSLFTSGSDSLILGRRWRLITSFIITLLLLLLVTLRHF
nr:thaumatin-like protein 1b [Coffea arabica]